MPQRGMRGIRRVTSAAGAVTLAVATALVAACPRLAHGLAAESLSVTVQAHAEAGNCQLGIVPVADIVPAVKPVGAPTPTSVAAWLSPVSSTPAGLPLPFTVLAGPTLGLRKAVDAGVHTFTLYIRDNSTGLTAHIDLDGEVTCGGLDEGGGGANHTVLVDANLLGLSDTDFTAGHENVNALASTLARGLGIPVGHVDVNGAVATGTAGGDDAGVRITVAVEVPASTPVAAAGPMTVAVTLDTRRVAGQPLRVRRTAFEHTARVVSRSLGVCCSASVRPTWNVLRATTDTTAMLAWWPLHSSVVNETDWSPTGLDGTIFGDAVWDDDGLVFAGNSWVASSADLPMNGDVAFTYSCWFRWDGASQPSVAMGLMGTQLGIGHISTAAYLTMLNGKPGIDYQNQATRAVSAPAVQTWHHIAITKARGFKDSPFTTKYVDGVSVPFIVDGHGMAPNIMRRPLVVGSPDASTPLLWQGRINDVRVYSVELTSTQVQGIYNATKSLHGIA